MGPLLSIILGIGVVALSYFLMKRELERSVDDFSSRYPGISDGNTKTILGQFDRMEDLINDLNASYYDLISDLEGKYSVHEKEISLLEEKLQRIQLELREVIRDFADEVRSLRESAGGPSPSGNLPSGAQSGQTWQAGQKTKASSGETSAQVSQEAGPDEGGPARTQRKLELLNLSDAERDKVRRNVIDLRQKGYALSRIARELHVGVGELQLFLNINRIK